MQCFRIFLVFKITNNYKVLHFVVILPFGIAKLIAFFNHTDILIKLGFLTRLGSKEILNIKTGMLLEYTDKLSDFTVDGLTN